MFHADDVPLAVLDAERAGITSMPRPTSIRAAVGRSLAVFAADVDVPVFLAYGGAIDIAPDRRLEPSVFARSGDVTVLIVPGAAHCHNASSQRLDLWLGCFVGPILAGDDLEADAC